MFDVIVGIEDLKDNCNTHLAYSSRRSDPWSLNKDLDRFIMVPKLVVGWNVSHLVIRFVSLSALHELAEKTDVNECYSSHASWRKMFDIIIELERERKMKVVQNADEKRGW